ncbi:MAG: hypothetical protein N3D10_03035 [Candidatus Micrarchaeota archaeon]|nr:hypothetical protein [Candidatus Micrarchaeota archaeon]
MEKETKNQPILAAQNPTEGQIYQFGLWLDEYEDIFSDFDPRPYQKRQISDDFIIELKKRIRETPKGEFEIAFYLPKEKRNPKLEPIIKKRLREHFDSELMLTEKIITKKQKKYLTYFLGGIFILFLSTYLSLEYYNEQLLVIGANLILPLGWFSIWTSLDYYLNQRKEDEEKILFFNKIKKCDFKFFDLELLTEQIGDTKQKIFITEKQQQNPVL